MVHQLINILSSVPPIAYRAGLSLLVAAVIFVFVNLLVSWPVPISRGSRGLLSSLDVTKIGDWMKKRFTPEVARRANIVEIQSSELLIGSVAVAVGFVVIGYLMMPKYLDFSLIVPAAIGFIITPSYLVRRKYKAYQQELLRNFPKTVMLLRIYFDLGFTLLDALKQVRLALSGYSLMEMDRVLQTMAIGNQNKAFKDWAERADLMEYNLLSDTITQQQGRSLKGEILKPLDTLIEASQNQNVRSITEKISSMSSAIPITATMGTVIIYMYSIFAGITGLQALHL